MCHASAESFLRRFLVFIVGLLLVGGGTQSFADSYVDLSTGSDLTGDGTVGTPWAHVSFALGQVSGPDTIHVAPGVYDTTADGEGFSETFPLAMVDGVSIIGDAGAATTVLDAQDSERVVHCIGVATPVTLSGLTLRGGLGLRGGGLHCDNSSLSMVGCIIEDNESRGEYSSRTDQAYGGGVYAQNSTLEIRACTIRNNLCSSYNDGGGMTVYAAKSHGGGVYVSGGTVNIVNNDVVDNEAKAYSFQKYKHGYGGGMCVYATGTISGNTFTGNIGDADRRSFAGTAALHCSGVLDVSHNYIVGNIVRSGIVNGGTAVVVANDALRFTNNLIALTEGADNSGGGIRCDGGTTEVVNNTLVDNAGHGIVCGATPVLRNNVFAGHTGYAIVEQDSSSDPLTVDHNLFFNNAGGLYRDENHINFHFLAALEVYVAEVADNLEADPGFVDALGGDYHLTTDSACINAGQNDASPAEDYDLEIRPQVSVADIGFDEVPGGGGGDTDPPVFAGAQAADWGDSSVVLSWSTASDLSTPLTYLVYEAQSAGAQIFSSPTYTTRATELYVHGLTNGTTYFYVVRALDFAGNIDSNTVELSGTPAFLGPGDYYVDIVSGSDLLGDGSESNPWAHLTYAMGLLHQATGTLHIAPGVYDTSLNAEGFFEMFPVTMKDGLSLVGTGGAEVTVLDAGDTGRVIMCSNVPGLVTISGLTLRGGYAQYGGAIHCKNSGLAVEDCVIEDNESYGDRISRTDWSYGGGIYAEDSTIEVQRCVFRSNVASSYNNGGGMVTYAAKSHGGGICVSGGYASIVDNTFADNEAKAFSYQGHRYGYGGGIYVSAQGVVTGNTLTGNIADAERNTYSGTAALWCSGELEVSGNRIIGNTVRNLDPNCGMAVYLNGDLLRFSNNIIAQTTGSDNSGTGIFCSASPELANNTIVGNEGHGILLTGAPRILNNIIVGHPGHGIVEASASADPVSADHNAFHDCVGGVYRDESSMTYTTVAELDAQVPECANNLQADPLFADDEYRLASMAGRWDPTALGGLGGWVFDEEHSPCIDAGNPASDHTAEPMPNGGRSNMGVYGGTAYAARSRQLAGTTLTLGLSVSDVIGTGERHYYALTVPAGENLLLRATCDSPGAFVRLFASHEMLPSPFHAGHASSEDFGANPQLPVPGTEAGTYYVLIHGANVPGGPAAYTLTGEMVDAHIGLWSPRSGGNAGRTRVEVTGLGFDEDMSVYLRSPSGVTVPGEDLYLLDETRFRAVFDLTGQELGLYDLVADFPQAGVLSEDDAFEVMEGVGPILEARLIAPEAVRDRGENPIFQNPEYVLWLEYENAGDSDLPMPIFVVEASNNTIMHLDRGCPAAMSSHPIRILGLGPEGMGAWVPPGAEVRVPIRFRANFTLPEATFTLTTIEENNEAFPWDDLEPQLKPTGIDPAEWAALWTNAKMGIGLTWREVFEALREAVDFSGASIRETRSFDDALAYLVALHAHYPDLPSSKVWSNKNDYYVARNDVRIGEVSEGTPGCETIIVTHGANSDGYELRFENFVARLKARNPDARILAVEWPKGADCGLDLWAASKRIPDVAARASVLLVRDYPEIDYSKTTFVGESFGNAVNAAISDSNGAVSKGILLNPANEWGFWHLFTPDYRAAFSKCHAYITNSWWDSRTPKPIADAVIYLTTPDWWSWNKKHTSGMEWLADQVGLGRMEFLDMTVPYPAPSWGAYMASVDIDGVVSLEALLMQSGFSIAFPFWPGDLMDQVRAAVVYSFDPNEKTGPAGIGVQGYVSGNDVMTYVVYFENLPAATAPAQQVYVVDTLDPELDWTSFRLKEFSFGEHLVSVPEDSDCFAAEVPVSVTFVTTDDIEVHLQAEMDYAAGRAVWQFTAIDPETGSIPVNPLVGFLPPEDDSGRGQGHVTFSVQPAAALPPGTVLTNQASIIFDGNAPIDTNVVTNTIAELDPDAPAWPVPADGAGRVPRTTYLNWADCLHAAGYDVYFGQGKALPLAQTNRPDSFATLGTLEYGSVYSWQIVAKNNTAGTTPGSVWTFTTQTPFEEWLDPFGGVPEDQDGLEDDPDGDGLSNEEEFGEQTHPGDPDSDGDFLNDGEEVNVHETDPNSADSDGDDLEDGEEIDTYDTDPLDADTDDDTLDDGAEVDLYNTDPNNPDSDGDGATDGEEVLYGTDPNDPLSAPSTMPASSLAALLTLGAFLVVAGGWRVSRHRRHRRSGWSIESRERGVI